MEVRLHPDFQAWLERLSSIEGLEDVFGEVLALIHALEERGRNLGEDDSKPVASSSYDLHALRRTPPSATTPHALGAPVLRILYGYARHDRGTELAVVAIGGDKTMLGNDWYPANITQAEVRIDQWCRNNPGHKPIIRKGGPR